MFLVCICTDIVKKVCSFLKNLKMICSSLWDFLMMKVSYLDGQASLAPIPVRLSDWNSRSNFQIFTFSDALDCYRSVIHRPLDVIYLRKADHWMFFWKLWPTRSRIPAELSWFVVGTAVLGAGTTRCWVFVGVGWRAAALTATFYFAWVLSTGR